MEKQKKASTKNIPEKTIEKALPKTKKGNGSNLQPIFVEAEKMFDRFNTLNREIGHKAFGLFLKRGGGFGNAFEDWLSAESELLLPVPVEVTENEKQFNIRASVVGFKPEEIEVSIKDNFLFLSGKTEMEERKEDENAVYEKWRGNRFFRAFILSSEVDIDKAKANLKDNVLQLTLPKLPENRPKHIPVNKE
jgi:HSP20 family protein